MQRLMILVFASALVLAPVTALAADDSIACFFHGAVHGKIEDCGCKSKPLGGVAGRAAMLADARAEHGDILLLDAGDLFAGKSSQEQCAFLAGETARLDYDAIGVGARDLEHGVDFLMKQASRHELPYVASNLFVDGERAFPTARLIDVDGRQIAIVSVLDGNALSGNGQRLTVQDPVEAVREALASVANADVVVLLTTSGVEEARSLVAEIDEIDLVIDGKNGRYTRARELEGAVLVAANPSGKYLGSLQFEVTKSGIEVADYELLDVDPKDPIDAEVAQRVADFVASQENVAVSSK